MIYLATPYAHHDPNRRALRYLRVTDAASYLMERGEHVFSPITHNHPIAERADLPRGWNFWESYDRKFLSMCDELVVFLQPGWKQSTGVTAEIAIAREMGIPVSGLRIRVGGRGRLMAGDNTDIRYERVTLEEVA
jgi:nucleoside 2-deoxyribosyltransferase